MPRWETRRLPRVIQAMHRSQPLSGTFLARVRLVFVQVRGGFCGVGDDLTSWGPLGEVQEGSMVHAEQPSVDRVSTMCTPLWPALHQNQRLS